MTTSPHKRRRILVLANETVASDLLQHVVAFAARDDGADVLVVAPALTTRLSYWASDDTRSRRAAEERLTICLASLRAIGLVAEGYVGDADPLVAADDALSLFAADELVVATRPEGRSNWLARNVVQRLRTRFRLPVHHIVVDATHEHEFVAA
jgi:hypothetical protein